MQWMWIFLSNRSTELYCLFFQQTELNIVISQQEMIFSAKFYGKLFWTEILADEAAYGNG